MTKTNESLVVREGVTLAAKDLLFGLPEVPRLTQDDFQAISVDDADRAIRQLARLTDQLESIEQWTKDAKDKLAPRIHEARELLAYFTENMREDTGESSIDLPSGKVSVRARPAKMVRDNDKLLALLADRIPDSKFWNEKITPAWKEIMGLLEHQDDGTFVVKGDGEVIPTNVLQKTDPDTKYSLTVVDSLGREL